MNTIKASEGNERKGSDRAERTAPMRLGGARADFVASLGRKVNDARAVLVQFEASRSAASSAATKGCEAAPAAVAGEGAPRDEAERVACEELRRRFHALGASARLLRFDGMSHALKGVEALLEAAVAHGAKPGDLATVKQVMDDLPALAWGEPPSRRRARDEAKVPRLALVVGPDALAAALEGEPHTSSPVAFEPTRASNFTEAIEAARSRAPDVILLDGDDPDAVPLVEALLDDPLTEPVPIVVVGNFRAPEQMPQLVALGVARALRKPVTPEEIAEACADVLEAREARAPHAPLGEPTLEELSDRLASEVRRALVDGVDASGRRVRVPLGEGSEVMGALWGAIARVREVILARTDGAIRFPSAGPDGVMAVAPWLHADIPGTQRLTLSGQRGGRGPAADVRLHGRRVVVADDDPGVTWFLADLLRAAGCVVHEALNGDEALALCYRTAPELLISDILMPGLDGFALARTLKRDVALRDVPVVLLSWKEDLLQRVRELGANAAAYMQKESDSRAILARVRECLHPRQRVETRLFGEGEVHGRLDGLTMHTLLELSAEARPNAHLSVRDASFLFEAELRDGSLRALTRTGTDGAVERGASALPSLLGAFAGRFLLRTSTAPVLLDEGLPTGSLHDTLAPPLQAARAAMRVVAGANTTHVHALKLDQRVLDGYVRSTPEPARTVVQKLASGRSPRGLVALDSVDPALLEGVLVDLAARGAIIGVWNDAGEDLLAPVLSELSGTAREDAARVHEAETAVPRVVVPSKPAGEGPISRSTPIVAIDVTFGPAEPTAFQPPFHPQASSPPPSQVEPAPPSPTREVVSDITPASMTDAIANVLAETAPPPVVTRRNQRIEAPRAAAAEAPASVAAAAPSDENEPAARKAWPYAAGLMMLVAVGLATLLTRAAHEPPGDAAAHDAKPRAAAVAP